MSDKPIEGVVEAPAEKAKKAKKVKPVDLRPKCSVCGKPLEDPESIKAGIGPLCRLKNWTKEKIDARMAELKADAAPEGWLKIADVHNELVKLGVPVARMVRAIGGDRGMEAPINDSFRIVYVGRTRYVSPECLNDESLKLLGDRYLGVPQEPKAPRTKAPKLDADGNPIPPKPRAARAKDAKAVESVKGNKASAKDEFEKALNAAAGK